MEESSAVATTTTSFKYNQGQQRAIDEITASLTSGTNNRELLLGAAGTGKTTTFQQILRNYQAHMRRTGDDRAIAVVGPTNKAVRVASEMAAEKGITGVTFKTIHSLLGLQVEDKNGRKGLKQRELEPLCDEYSLIVPDEGSMIDEAITEKFFAEAWGCNVLGVGDHRQLPPVKRKTQDSKLSFLPQRAELQRFPFFSAFENVHTLTEVMRQKGSPAGAIVDALSSAVEQEIRLDPRQTDLVNKWTRRGTKGAWYVDVQEFYQKWIVQAFGVQKEKKEWNDSRVICFYHRSIRQINQFIRVAIYGDPARQADYLPGEPLICLSPVVRSHWDDEQMEMVRQIIFSTATEMPVLSAFKGEHSFEIDGTWIKYPCWFVSVMGGVGPIEMKIVPNDYQDEYDRQLERLKKEAIKTRYWKSYYKLKEQFDDVRVAYCLTSYSAQGSTFKNAFIPVDDHLGARVGKDASENADIQMRSLYVAASRGSDKIIMC